MAKTDELMKNLFKHKEIFADLFNATIFNGQQLIKPEKLTEINTENIHIEDSIQDKDNINSNITKRYRDLCMRQNDSILQIILGCEDQSEVDYSMPIRTMLYDSLKYTEQQKNLELKSIIPNYKMNLLWAYNIKDIDKFKSDLQYILYMLKYKEEKENLKEYISENNDNLQKMNQDSHNVAVALLNHKLPELIEDDKKGEIRMGKNAIEAIEKRGEINISLEINNNNVHIKISNNGNPISPEKQNAIFEEGFTTKQTGSGLGLHICTNNLKAQNAILKLNCSTPQKTEFEIILPIYN